MTVVWSGRRGAQHEGSEDERMARSRGEGRTGPAHRRGDYFLFSSCLNLYYDWDRLILDVFCFKNQLRIVILIIFLYYILLYCIDLYSLCMLLGLIYNARQL